MSGLQKNDGAREDTARTERSKGRGSTATRAARAWFDV